MSKKSDPKLIYGAGFHAGVKAAGAKADNMAMTALRQKTLIDQQSGIAKKIYECVPVNEAFDANRICSELKRAGSAPDIHIVRGCLNTLKESGLIAEGLPGLFQRVKVRAEVEAVKQVTPIKISAESIKQNAPTPDATDPLEIFAAAASQLRSVSKTLEGIAVEVEDAALQIEDSTVEKSEEVKRLRQLANLLKQL